MSPSSQDVGLGDKTSSSRRTMLRRASREGCTLLLGTCRSDRVGPVMAAVIVEIGIVQAVVVMVGIVVAIALMWIVVVVFVVVVFVVVAIAWPLQ